MPPTGLPITSLPTGLPLTPDWTALPGAPDEITDLVTAAADERADAMGEIMSQSDEFISYFLNVVCARPASHPATTCLLTIAAQIGTFIVMSFKEAYLRPRPSQVCPGLLPPLEVPGHASFPSGHSTQAHLMALCLENAMKPPTSMNPDPTNTTQNTTIGVLADRIARNREIAGLHYKADSDAGVAIAKSVFALLPTTVAGTNLRQHPGPGTERMAMTEEPLHIAPGSTLEERFKAFGDSARPTRETARSIATLECRRHLGTMRLLLCATCGTGSSENLCC